MSSITTGQLIESLAGDGRSRMITVLAVSLAINFAVVGAPVLYAAATWRAELVEVRNTGSAAHHKHVDDSERRNTVQESRLAVLERADADNREWQRRVEGKLDAILARLPR